MSTITKAGRPTLPEPAMTVAEFARAMSVSEWTVRVWLRNGRVRGVKLGAPAPGAQWRIPRSELERLGAA